MFHKKRSGFTLIELLVVIAIIGILATIAVVALQNARAKARDARRIADVKQMQTALELFFNDQQRYPTTAEFNAGSIFSTTTNGTTTYMAKIPVAPTPNDNTCATADNNYTYTSNDGATYSLSFCLGGPTGTTRAGVNAASPIGISYIGSGNSMLLAAGGCSCTNAALPCCDACDPSKATCVGGTYCARNTNCSGGQYCINGTCANATGPQTVNGLMLWYRADSGVVTTTGNYVAQWNDQSGSGDNAAQSVQAQQPTLVNNSLNGYPVVHFNGSNGLNLSNLISLTGDFTYFQLFKQDVSNSVTIGLTNNSAYVYLFGNYSDGSTYIRSDAGYFQYNKSAYPAYVVICVKRSSGVITIYENGTPVYFNNLGGNFYLNDFGQAVYGYSQAASFAEILLYNSAVSDSNRQVVETYLNSKYNVHQ